MFRKLRADEIEVRVGSVVDGAATLLLYKDARCDMNILDETMSPLYWKRSHSRDNANCTVSIYNHELGEWVSKEDTGTESNTEREKGLASDSFKRACVNWGIGRELYTAPRIKINCETKPKSNGYGYELANRWEFYGAYVSMIDYDESGSISALEIKKFKDVIFSMDNRIESYPKVEEEMKDMNDKISDAQRETVLSMMDEARVDIDVILTQYKIETLADMTKAQYGKCMNRLKATKEQKK